MEKEIKTLEQKIKKIMSGEATGHDWYHVKQVRDLALRIAEKEGGDKEIIELVALAHDIGDRKFYPVKEVGQEVTKRILLSAGVPDDLALHIIDITDEISWSEGKIPESLEGKIVQDADRLYALGAIGIARTFAFGGKKDRVIHDPEQPRNFPTTINHFYEKLLLVKDRMNTESAKKIAASRHAFMEEFLEHFYAEWDARD